MCCITRVCLSKQCTSVKHLKICLHSIVELKRFFKFTFAHKNLQWTQEKLNYHYSAARAPLPLRFPPLPEEHPCKYRIVHKGLKGDATKTLSLSRAESSNHERLKLLILIKEWEMRSSETLINRPTSGILS